MKRLVRSNTQKLASERGPVFPHDDAHSHEAFARDPARGDRERVLLCQSRMTRLQPPADEGADEEEQAVVPVEGPREAYARG